MEDRANEEEGTRSKKVKGKSKKHRKKNKTQVAESDKDETQKVRPTADEENEKIKRGKEER